ncbi:MAG TPA: hypothetical protein VK815_03290 [Candidatus Acidoferrales bacterium]|jgi:hypothetical protein|nr:hypothetical protein [Candidatus Acidoferrales bacterium]
MEEKLKSIWRKPWRGPLAWLLGWVALMLALALIFWLVLSISGSRPRPAEDARLFWSLAAGMTLLMLLVAFIRWLANGRNLKRFIFLAACAATLVGLFYAEEDWRGKRAWENYKHEWEAKGERFDFASIVPPPVPDEKNFAMTPVMYTSYGFILTRDGRLIPSEQRPTNWVNRLEFKLGDDQVDDGWNTNAIGYWARGTLSNLKLWQEHYRELAAKTNEFAVPPQPGAPAADVLLALSKYDATVEELRQAAQLPECRFPLNYDADDPAEIYLPHLAALKRSSRLLELRALAELENGESDKALADVMLTLRLSEHVQREPTLIGMLVRIAMTDIAMQPVYEGLAKHRWTDAQLAAMEAEMAKIDFLADFTFSMRCERAFAGGILDYISRKDRVKRYDNLTSYQSFDEAGKAPESPMKGFFLRVEICLMPQGWFELNKLTIARMHETWLLHITDPEKHQVMPQMVIPQQWQPVNTLFNIFARELIPELPNSAKKSARGQMTVDLARTAMALERYRLAHGEYPETLDGLAPQFIAQVPHDVIGGGPLKYRRTSDGLFVLYSIGWNEKDDGGVMVDSGSQPHIDERRSQPRFEEGDWVWRYPQK